MSERKTRSKQPSGLTEVKLLITTGTVAATLLGWGALALRKETADPMDLAEANRTGLPPSLTFLGEPLPTVVVPQSLAGTMESPVAPQGLRTVDAPPPVKVITITKSASGAGSGRTQSSR